MRYSTLLIAIGMSLVIYYTLKKWTGLPNVESEKSKWYFRIMPIALLGIALYLSVRCMDMPYIAMWKRICILGILWGIAYVDQKENIIPNQYLLLCLGLRGIIFLIEILQNPMDAAAQMIAELIGCGVLLAFSLLIRILSRKGLGMGDVKLFSILPLFLGALGGMRAVIYSMLIIFVQAVFCLITKRIGKKDVLPFAPAIAGGTWIIVILSGV